MNNPVFTFENLYRAYLSCRKNKRSRKKALEFELHAEEELLKLTRELQKRTYRILPSACFVTESPKPREVFAANFRDRIIHHLLVRYLEPQWEPRFIHDSYACRKGKGTHSAVKRVQFFMRKVSHNRSRPAFFLQIDIRSFFMSINKQILFKILQQKEDNPNIIWLLQAVIFHDPSMNPEIKGQLSLFDLIPPHKSLFYTNNIKGLAIGNYTSQFFANVYLNEVDQFIKHHLKCRYYLRYVDDLVLLSHNRAVLEQYEKAIRKFLQTRLRLDLNMNRRTLAPVSNGCNFLGYVIRPSHLLVRKRCVNNLKHKLIQQLPLLSRIWQGRAVISHDVGAIEKLRSLLVSYLGHFEHASSHRLIDSIFERHFLLNNFFINKKGKLKLVENPPRFANLYSQYRWFCKQYYDCFIFFQVGSFYEFYGKQGKTAQKIFNLKPGNSRRGLGLRTGFPAVLLKKHIRIAAAVNDKIVVINQTGQQAGSVEERRRILHFSTIIKTIQGD